MNRHRRRPIVLIATILACLMSTDRIVSGQPKQSTGGLEENERQAAKQPPRRLYRREGQPIQSQIHPTDGDVEVISPEDPGFFVDLGNETLPNIARKVDIVAVIRVTEIHSIFTPDASWINSTVTATLIEVLRKSNSALPTWTVGGEFRFPVSGGVASIGSRRITAKSSWAKPLEVDKEYLVFGNLVGASPKVFPDNTFGIVGGRIVPNRTDAAAIGSFLDGELLSEVRDRINSIK